MKINIKGYMLATASTAVLVSVASAADMPVYKAPPAPVYVPPPVTWAGPYIGFNVGAVWAKTEASEYAPWDSYYGYVPASVSKTKVGGTVGAQMGYNWQSGPWVYGAEGDINWVSAKASVAGTTYAGGSAEHKLNWLGTVRGRLGYSWNNTFMVYGTGGVAFGGVKNTWGNGYYSYSDSSTRTGWTAGGGFEWMFAPKWSMKGEALYVDLGKKTVSSCFYGCGYSTTFKNTEVIARIGVNYHW